MEYPVYIFGSDFNYHRTIDIDICIEFRQMNKQTEVNTQKLLR